MLKLYKITETHKDGTTVETVVLSFNAYDALEEHFFEIEQEVDDIAKISVEYVRNTM